jgi:GH25 family lysozyme M1 (1,4-beta-N-acetylmuramidase)
MSLLGTDFYAGNADAKIQAAIARADMVFHIIKATEGKSFADQDYLRNRDWARDAGDVDGAYHFAWMSNSGADEAKWFLDTAQPRPGQLIAGDWEDWGPKDANGVRTYMVGVTWRQRWQHALDWTRIVMEETKTRPLCYVNWNYIKNFRDAATVAEWEWWIDNPLWLAQWQTGGVQTKPGQFDWASPKAGSTKEWHPTFHQYISGSTSPSGLDENWFVGDRAALLQYTIQEDTMSAAEVQTILTAIANVQKQVDAVSTALTQKASTTDVKAATTAITALQTKMQEINGNIGIANAEVVGKMEEVAKTLNDTIDTSIKDALSGVNISTNITFPTN